MKINQALMQGAETLRRGKSEINIPLLEAELLLAHVLDKDRIYVICYPAYGLTQKEEICYIELIGKRAAGCPMAYLTGRKEFMGLELYVDENVLIPRDDTEILIRCVLDIAHLIDNAEILNIGTGSGCIETALAFYNKNIKVTGVEKYKKAINAAKKNIDNFSLSGRVTLIQSDMFAELDEDKCFDIICSNPPYITKEEMDALSIDIRDYEPHNALYGGVDGLDYYKIIARESKKYLKPRGFAAVEIGCTQADLVKEIFIKNGYKNIICHKDLSSRNRVIAAQY